MPQAIHLPDFDAYPTHHHVSSARPVAAGRAVALTWDDEYTCRFHVFTLKENAPDSVHPVSREQVVMLMDLPDDLRAVAAGVDARGVWVQWSTGGTSCFDAGWLRAHATQSPTHVALPPRALWDIEALPAVPRFGPRVRTEGSERTAWLGALHTYGVAVVEGLGTDERVIEQVPTLIGPLRETNFGRSFVVETRPDAISNAYTAMALPVHTDLCTREYEPGLQFLHCIHNSADGGESILVDGFFIAEQLRRRDPEAFDALSTFPIPFANKAHGSDFRHSASMFTVDTCGAVAEVRWSPWLRGPLQGPFEVVDAVYRGLRLAFRMAEDPACRLVLKLAPGELLCFDNRRTLHGRNGYDPQTGRRKLVGAYGEREDLYSALRMAGRSARAAEAGR